MRLLSTLAALSWLSTLVSGATVCNGQASLCSKAYSAVTFIGTHNSYSIGQNLANNQNKDVTAQLVSLSPDSPPSALTRQNDGVRTLQSQA
jgi:hypothetical protein